MLHAGLKLSSRIRGASGKDAGMFMSLLYAICEVGSVIRTALCGQSQTQAAITEANLSKLNENREDAVQNLRQREWASDEPENGETQRLNPHINSGPLDVHHDPHDYGDENDGRPSNPNEITISKAETKAAADYKNHYDNSSSSSCALSPARHGSGGHRTPAKGSRHRHGRGKGGSSGGGSGGPSPARTSTGEFAKALNTLNLVMLICASAIFAQLTLLMINQLVGYASSANKSVGPVFFYWVFYAWYPLWGTNCSLLYLVTTSEIDSEGTGGTARNSRSRRRQEKKDQRRSDNALNVNNNNGNNDMNEEGEACEGGRSVVSAAKTETNQTQKSWSPSRWIYSAFGYNTTKSSLTQELLDGSDDDSMSEDNSESDYSDGSLDSLERQRLATQSCRRRIEGGAQTDANASRSITDFSTDLGSLDSMDSFASSMQSYHSQNSNSYAGSSARGVPAHKDVIFFRDIDQKQQTFVREDYTYQG